MNGPPTYNYRPLQARRNFRLLRLFRNFLEDDSQPIHADVLERDLDQCEEYEAMSYAWQGTHRTKPIICDQQVHYVTESCDLALRRCLRGRLERLIWVDAVCINQNDNDEKSIQVAMMGDIYTKAARINVFLTTGSSYTDEAVSTMRTLATARLVAIVPGPFPDTRQKSWRKKVEAMLALDRRRLDVLPFGVFGEIFRLPWWHRMWVVQEVALADASRVRFYLGTKILALETIYSGTSYPREWNLSPVDDHYRAHGELLWHLRSIIKTRREGKAAQVVPLTFLLGMLSLKDATNPVDKIFGLHAIAEALGLTQYLPVPDYNKPVAQVYTEAAHAAILTDSSLQIFDLLSCKPQVANLPSWVPDFSQLSFQDTSAASGTCRASGESTPMFWFDDSPRRLTVQGYFIDTIAFCGQTVEWDLNQTIYRGSRPTEAMSAGVWEAMANWYLCWQQFKAHKSWGPDSDLRFAQLIFKGGLIQQSNEEMMNHYRRLEAILIHGSDSQRPDVVAAIRDIRPAFMAFISMNANMKFVITQSGHIATAGARAIPGDRMVIFAGVKMFSVIRQVEDNFQMIGSAYVQGAMKGEVWPSDPSHIQDFKLV